MRHVSLLALGLLAAGCATHRTTTRLDMTPSCISGERLTRDIETLASDDFMGRGTGEEGIRMAEEHVAAVFAEAGLSPLPGRSDYYVPFDLFRQGLDVGGSGLTHYGPRGISEYEAGQDFRPFNFSDDGVATGSVVFAGYGITSEEHDWNDYAGLDVAGKFVFIFRYEPRADDPDSVFDGTTSTSHAQFVTKARVAQENGALGMILVTGTLNHEGPEDLRIGGALRLSAESFQQRQGGEEEDDGRPFLALQVSRRLAEELYAGVDLKALQQSVDDGTRPAQMKLPRPNVRVAVAYHDEPEKIPCRNVCGILPGAERPDEWIVIGAHHDHLGSFEGDGVGDSIFNGADDNASGTSGLLEVARCLSSRGAPRRTIAFCTFSAEERGLLGSRALVANEELPLEQVGFMLNLDMIGRNAEAPIEVVGDGFATGLREHVLAANEPLGVSIKLGGTSYMGASDHDSFYRRDIPFMFFFSGLHEDYHQLGDHSDRIQHFQVENVTRLARNLIVGLDSAPELPSFIHNVGWLGATIQVVDDAATITSVDAESRAEKAGLQVGDLIAAVSGETLTRPEDVGQRFRDIETGTTTTLGLLRDGAPASADIERAPTGYLGIFPQGVSEEIRKELGLLNGEGITVSRVVEDSPASKGGMKDGDILIRIAGQPVDRSSLGRHLARLGAGETVEMTVIREEGRKTLEVTLGERPQR